ncbi:Oidioi.mRNA.OKI2018_I69.XSR.g16829.t1.cds [Oikopleura dioica]|uniref:Oidioi.mRNA.OKI2018_I69.XSR.g16829.t1.cds n=1 Tax=Oikopleura dioica TaxID=34765 RepID=A0ABN7SRQ5_OIKDI|nr:Oidioi.mRNA.OKI2018_I69.XSR.g16829.t1.cds [Oikopleura dioica]
MDLDNYLNFNEPGHPHLSDNGINNAQNIGICMNDQNLRRELLGNDGQHGNDQSRQQSIITVQQPGDATGSGQVRVFIIRDQVKNVIQAGNNLIVETAKNDGAKIAPQTSYIQGVMKDNTFQQSSPVSLSGSEQSSQLQSNQQGQTGQEAIQENGPPTPKIAAQKSPGEPLIKPKGKKRPVPAHQKDELYWERRRKNNLAAKRSRESRRLRDNQTTMRTGFLENENMELREKINQVRSEILDIKEKLQEYNAIYRGTEVSALAEAAAVMADSEPMIPPEIKQQ